MGNIAQWGNLTQRRRVSEEGLRVVKLCFQERMSREEYALRMTVPEEEAPANYVPAAAVRRRGERCPNYWA